MKKFLISSLAALLVMLALPIAGVFAASVTPQVQKHNCVVKLSPIRAGQLSSDIVSTKCFATFSQTTAFATNGASTAATPKDLTAAQVKNPSVHPLTPTTIGILYTSQNEHTGGMNDFTLTVQTSDNNPACRSTNDYGLSSLTPYGWEGVTIGSVAVLRSGWVSNCYFTSLFPKDSYADVTPTGTSICMDGTSNTPGTGYDTDSVIFGELNPASGPHPTAITCS